MTVRAIYPGTFDPITRGHFDVIKRAINLVDELIIGVACDVLKSPLFSAEDRVAMIEKDVSELMKSLPAHKSIKVIAFKGLLVNFAQSNDIKVIIRGLRAVSDFEYEFQLASANAKLNKDVETVFIPANEKTHFISATIVKEVARLGGDISCFVTPYVEEKLVARFK